MANTESLLLPESIGKRVDPTYSKTLQTRLQELLHSQNDCFPGSQPVSFESKHLEDIQREDYFVCEKSDGVRYLLFFLHSSKGPASFLYDRNKYWYYVPNLLFPLRGRDNEYLKDTLMDGELVLDIDQHKKTWRYLIFDLMVVNGSTIIQRSFSTRLGMLQQDVIQPFNARMRTQIDPSGLPPFTVELKKMERSYGLHLVFEQIPKLKHKSDGIIWTPVKYPYTSGTCEKLLKWKPPELNTVDFRISARWSKEHKPIYSIEVLSNGVTYKFYDHFQPEPALATQWKSQLPDGRIAEFRYDSDCEVTIIEQGYAPTIRKGGWRFVRFRDDKSTANDEMVVKKILHSIQDGVTREQLLLCMDRVRAAWKAREKGLPMPPLHSKPTSLSLLTQLPPTISALNTPTSSIMLQSPSTSLVTGYFREREDSSRNNSISEDIPSSKRKSSISSVTTPLKEQVTESDDAERKRLKAVEEEKEEESIHVNNTTTTTTNNNNIPMESIQVKKTTHAPLISSPRRRKISIVNVKKVQLAEPDPLPPPLLPTAAVTSLTSPNIIEKKQRKMTTNVSKRIVSSVPNVFIKQEESTPPLPTSPKPPLPPPLDSAPRNNRRSKSIPQQLHKESNSKKIKPSSSSSIHNLLTTSVEPTTRAYNFSTILQKEEVQPTITQPVQFINFHAEGRNQATNSNHILIIRSETNSQTIAPSPPVTTTAPVITHAPVNTNSSQSNNTTSWKNNSFADNPYHPPYQEYYQPYSQPSQPSQPYRQQQVAHEYQSQQQPPPQAKRKNSQKAKLDFILN